MGVAYSTTALVVLESAPPGEEGGASAALQLGNVLGIALGTGAGGAVLARATAAGGSTGGAIAMSHAIAWLAAVAAIALASRLRGRARVEDRCSCPDLRRRPASVPVGAAQPRPSALRRAARCPTRRGGRSPPKIKEDAGATREEMRYALRKSLPDSTQRGR